MALTSINNSKDLAQAYQPLLLAVVTFSDGSVLRLATHPLNTAEGGFQYGGQDYVGRIIDYDIGAFQGYDTSGIDVIPKVSMVVADADKAIKINYEDAKGFAGARLDLTFVLWDANTSTYSSDNILKFRGICDAAETDFETLTVTASNKLNLQRKQLPNVLIQRRCPWINPTTTAQRATANDEDSFFYECGETRDLTTAPPCSYTKATCTQPNRFGGIVYDTPANGRSREYTSGNWIDIANAPNDMRYGHPVPMVYGTAWVNVKIAHVFGDGNSTRGEAIVCLGEVNQILRVVVNDTELQPATDITGGVNYIVRDALLRYNVVNRGDRDGSPNLDTPYNGNGDPYGSMCAILWVVPRRVSESSQRPRLRVLVQGPKIRVYTGVSTFSKAYTANPVWVLMDLLTWAGLDYADLDIQSFIEAAAICDASISYTDQYGGTSSHARYSCSLVIDQRRSAAEIIRAVRMSCGAILVPNGSAGTLQIFIEGTMASQQPSAVSGSNNSSPITSKNLAGTTTNGYSAYDFSKVLMVNGKSSLRVSPRAVSSTPNRVQFRFANTERDSAEDSLSLLNVEAVNRAAQENIEQLQVEGIATLDQAKRIAARRLARNLLGNPRGDAAGTEVYEWIDTQRAIRLRVGQICRLSDTHYGLSNVQVRLLQIRPTKNFETVKIMAERHDDNWFVDSFGQAGDPALTEIRRDRLARPSYPWCPMGAQPLAGDPMFTTQDWSFFVRESSEEMRDGTSIAKVQVLGNLPVNMLSDIAPPIIGRQGTTSGASGTFPGGGWTYYAAVCAKDSDGLLSAHSGLCEIVVTNPTSVNNITIPVLNWPSGASGYVVYVGNTPQLLTKHVETTGTPSSITVTGWRERHFGVPDPEFDRLRLKMKRVLHSGVWGAALTGIGTGTLTVAGAGWTTNEWANRDCSIIGRADKSVLTIDNFRVTSNTGDTLTVTPNPATYGLAAGDALVMRSLPTIGADSGGNFVSDALWANSISGSGLTVDGLIGFRLRFISGPGRGDGYRIKSNTATKIYIEGEWIQTPTSDSRYIVEEMDWQIQQTSDSIDNPNQFAEFTSTIECSNYSNQTLLIEGATLDGGGNESLGNLNPCREIYIYGRGIAAATAGADGYATMAVVSDEVTPDLADGLNQKVTMTANLTVNEPILTGGALQPGVYLLLKFTQDSTGGHSLTWDSIFKGVTNEQPDPTPDTYSKFQFTYDGTDWELDSSQKGLS